VSRKRDEDERRAETKGSPNIAQRLAVSVLEAAKMIGVGRSTVCKLVKQKVLPSKKLGNRRLILVADIEAFLHGLSSTT
jgi:excisionase family DNA binding protein